MKRKRDSVTPEEHKTFLIKAITSIIFYSLFLEKTTKPRSDDGYPLYKIPLSSLEINDQAIAYQISTITKECISLQKVMGTDISAPNDNTFNNSKYQFVIKLKKIDTGKMTLTSIKKKLMDIRKLFIEEIDNIIKSQGDKCLFSLENSSNKFSDEVMPRISESFLPEIFIEEIQRLPFYQDQIVPKGHFVIPARNAIVSNVYDMLPENFIKALSQYWGISYDDVAFYNHQYIALKSIFSGSSVVVSTDTSSGKSLVYQIPVFKALQEHYETASSDFPPTAFFMFPTKALAQDQLRSFQVLSSLIFGNKFNISSHTYDGDTDFSLREQLRNTSSILFCNPDILHSDILPRWIKWERFLKALKFIVIDEIHIYTGVFGTNVAYTLRRLKRICHELGNSKVQIISCSATIKHPENLLKSIFLINENDLVVIDANSNGAPSGDRHWLVWNSPYINGTKGPYCRAHPIQNGTILFAELLCRNVRTLAFCKTRRECELFMKSIQNELESRGLSHVQEKVMTYRGGYCTSDRREIEYKMSTGCFIGIISTSALELGLDIGEMDAILHIGFPYSIANLRQQAGRAGRRGRSSLSILIGGNGPIDQYYMSNPSALLDEDDPEITLTLGDNEILNQHLQCAAYEIPISIESDKEYFSNEIDENFSKGKSFKDLVKEKLVPIDDKNKEFVFYGPTPDFMPFPSSNFSLRSNSENEGMSYVVMTSEKILENIEIERVPFTLYEGGIFLSQGNMYLIEVLDIKG